MPLLYHSYATTASFQWRRWPSGCVRYRAGAAGADPSGRVSLRHAVAASPSAAAETSRSGYRRPSRNSGVDVPATELHSGPLRVLLPGRTEFLGPTGWRRRGGGGRRVGGVT